MNTPRAIQVFVTFALCFGAVIAFAGEPAAAIAPVASHAAAKLAPSENIPSIVITAKRLTAEQKASMDQQDGKQDKRLANRKAMPKGAKSSGSVG